MIRKERSAKEGYVRVIFELPASLWAGHVYLVGDFNHWQIGSLPFQQAHDGVWRITLELPAHRHFEFRYLIDGRWCSEYHADGAATTGRNGFNSVVETTLPPQYVGGCVGHGMVHESAHARGMDFPLRRHR
jgi:1,4-alpha-glucan branching enzyme